MCIMTSHHQQQQQQHYHRAESMQQDEDGDHNNNKNNDDDEEESRSLQYLLGGGSDDDQAVVANFFEHVYQVSCALYSTHPSKTSIQQPIDDINTSSGTWDLERALENPLRCLIEQGWQVVCDLLDQKTTTQLLSPIESELTPLLFRDCTRITIEERCNKYSFLECDNDEDDTGIHAAVDTTIGSNSDTGDVDPTNDKINLWAAFLDGCSIVLNHCDRLSPWIATLCQDLQHSFPHAYANAYVTPPQSQTVPGHADDRDVFIIQVYGRKHWRVYQHIPIPYPYSHEQVGKDDPELPVPESVLQGPILLERILEPGDCLYMPRGYVHEARSCSTEDCSSSSFHVTVALATHDWTLAGWLARTAEQVWTRQLSLRRAVVLPRRKQQCGGRRRRHTAASLEEEEEKEETAKRQAELDAALNLLREEITVANLDQALHAKYERHNQQAARVRLPLMESYYNVSKKTALLLGNTTTATVGRAAASTVVLQSWIRAATVEEKAQLLRQKKQPSSSSLQVVMHQQLPPPRVGLHVRNETYNGILALLKELSNQHPISFMPWQPLF